MKKLLLTALAASFCIGSYAQTEKGNTIIGGSVSFKTDKMKAEVEHKFSSFSLGPSLGFFVAKNTALGLGLAYSYQKKEPYSRTEYFDGLPYINGASGNKSNSFGINPFFRYYVDLHERVKFFGQVDAGIHFGNGTMINIDGSDGEKSKSTTYLSNIQPGIAVFPTKGIAIELKVPLLSYFNQRTDYKEPNSTDSRYAQFGFGSDLTKPVIGINFHF